MPQSEDPMDFVSVFARCPNYPRDIDSLKLFAKGLQKASSATGILMAQIVESCAAQSQYCPTDHDLLEVAKEIRQTRKRAEEAKVDKTAELRKEFGTPIPFDLSKIDLTVARKNRAEHSQLWEAARGLGLDMQELTHFEIAQALRLAGWPKTAHQGEVLKAWQRDS